MIFDGIEIPDHDHSPSVPPFCDICPRLVAEKLGLVSATSYGSAIDDDGILVHWQNGDYVDPALLERALPQ